MTIAEETIQLIESLPADKAAALVEYARYLAEKSDEEEWERKFNDPKYFSKLKARLAEVDQEIAQGQSEPLDLRRL